MTPEQQALIEQLYENESLTDNLSDVDAKALLKWAEEQVRNETDGGLVAAAVNNANQSGVEGAQALLTQASAFLVQELHAREANVARAADQTGAGDETAAQGAPAPTASTMSDDDTRIQKDAASTMSDDDTRIQKDAASTLADDDTRIQKDAASTPLSGLGIADAGGTTTTPSATGQAALAPVIKSPPKKRRRPTKRKKK